MAEMVRSELKQVGKEIYDILHGINNSAPGGVVMFGVKLFSLFGHRLTFDVGGCYVKFWAGYDEQSVVERVTVRPGRKWDLWRRAILKIRKCEDISFRITGRENSLQQLRAVASKLAEKANEMTWHRHPDEY